MVLTQYKNIELVIEKLTYSSNIFLYTDNQIIIPCYQIMAHCLYSMKMKTPDQRNCITFKPSIMKNLLAIIATFVLVSTASFATNTTTTNRYFLNYGDSFTFVEGGITFAVFQNGEFDFYINPRNGLHVGYSSRNVNISFNSGYNYDAYVQYDHYGAIIQVEHIPIYYDYYGRVSQIGDINIRYTNGRLVRLGGLHVHYDHYGYYSHYNGYINHYNRHYVYHPYHNFFVRPLFDFRIVSYKPYRHQYRPVRYKYYRDHSRNKYYSRDTHRYYKRSNKSTRQRVATNRVPKSSNDRIARTTDRTRNRNAIDRGNARNANTRATTTNRTQRSNGNNNRAVVRDNVDNKKRAVNADRARTTSRTPAAVNRNSNSKSRTTATKRTQSSVKRNANVNAHKRSTTVNRQPVRTERKSSISRSTQKPSVKKSSTTVRSRSTQAKPNSSVKRPSRAPAKKANTRTDYGKRKRG